MDFSVARISRIASNFENSITKSVTERNYMFMCLSITQ